MDRNDKEYEAHIGQEVQNAGLQKEKEIESQRQIITRKQRSVVSKEAKDTIQAQSLDHKVLSLEKKVNRS